jgi:hypothetical protein
MHGGITQASYNVHITEANAKHLTLHVKKIMSTEDIAKATGLTATEIDLL